MERFKIVGGSQSSHCCFGATVVDTQRPVMMDGEHYAPNGTPMFEAVCECFQMNDAELVCRSLNAALDIVSEPE